MFLTQLKIFFICVAVGGCGGLAHSLFALTVRPLKNTKKEGAGWFIYDLCFAVSLAVAFLAIQSLLSFPEFRLYMAVGLGVGFWLYYKFLRFLLAFFEKVCYNIKRKVANVKTLKNKR
jgi:hypothetical protein